MDARRWYVVDTDGLTADQAVHACRVVLEAFTYDIAKGECDIPWTPEEWPPEVLGAATRLRHRFVAPRKQNEHYMATGIVDLRTREVWGDFVTFAPYALDALVLGKDGVTLVSLADSATSIAVYVPPSTADRLAAALRPVRLVEAPPARLPSALSRLRRSAARVRRRPAPPWTRQDTMQFVLWVVIAVARVPDAFAEPGWMDVTIAAGASSLVVLYSWNLFSWLRRRRQVPRGD